MGWVVSLVIAALGATTYWTGRVATLESYSQNHTREADDLKSRVASLESSLRHCGTP